MAMTSSIAAVVVVVVSNFLRFACSSADVSISAVGVARSDNTQPLFIQRGDMLQLACSSTSIPPLGGSGDDDTITWYHNDVPVDPTATILTPAYRRLGTRNADLTSRLTIQDASEMDSGRYTCVRGQWSQGDLGRRSDHMDVLVVTGLHRSHAYQTSVSIVDPPGRILSVRYGQSFTLKCVTARRDRLPRRINDRRRRRLTSSDVTSAAGSLQWHHNGVPLTDGSLSDGGQSSDMGNVCGRIVITDAVDVDTGWMTSLMTCRSAGAREAGVYECLDALGVASDNVTVNVDEPSLSRRIAVEIVQPTSNRLRVDKHSYVDVKCKADMSAALAWFFNGTTQLVSDLANGFNVVYDIDHIGGWRISLLQLSNVVESRTGQYTCRNQHDVTDNDTLTILVSREQTAVESEEEREDETVPTKTSVIVMRIRSSVTLQCSVKAAETGEVYAEWKKNETILQNNRKYVITQEADVSSLTILRTELTDVGQYRCMFRHKDRRKSIVGILTFDVVTRSCPPLLAPPNGRLESCPQRPRVLGAMCTFQCNSGYVSSDPDSRTVCDQRVGDSRPYWTRTPPTCSNQPNIPSTTSTFFLPVGSNFRLRCTDSVLSWTKDGVKLENGSKYQMNNNLLTVKNAVRTDVGTYVCNIQRDSVLIGRNKFNVVTRSCPPITTSPGVLVDKCPDAPVYGDNCTFRCAYGRTLSAGNRVRSCEVKEFDTVYWSGEPPVCSVRSSTVSNPSYSFSGGYGKIQDRVQGSSSSVNTHIPSTSLIALVTCLSGLLVHLLSCPYSWR